MSNPDRPSVLQHAVPDGVVATRWWWVRHAPVREDNGCIYGQEDIGCDTSDRVVFVAVWKNLPRRPGGDAGNLKPTPPTPRALLSPGLPQPSKMQHQAPLGQQHLGEMPQLNRAA